MILIKNAQLFDGTGAPPRKSDVLIKGDRILGIGAFPNKKADEVIDALGMMLTPGFIDVHNESDHYLTLFSHPSHEDFLLQGVTTVIGGQCGASLAPLLYGSLEAIRKWADTNSINVNWHTLSECFATVKTLSLGVNWGTFVGHSTVRRAILGEALRDLTERELAVMERIMDEALAHGALGISTGLSYTHTKQTPFRELMLLAKCAARANAVYATHLRNESEEVVKAIDETIYLAETTHARTIVSHFRPLRGFERHYATALADLETRAKNLPLYFTTNASDMNLAPLYTLLPLWAQRGSFETMRDALREPHTAERIARALPQVSLNDILIMRAPDAEYLEGLTLARFAKNRGLRAKDALFVLMQTIGLRTVVLYRNTDLDFKVQTLQNPRALVGSFRPTFPPSSRGQLPLALSAPFAQYLEAVNSLKLMPMPEAIARVTGHAAAHLGLTGRGIVREGMAADLVLFESARASHVWVNGTHVVRDGVFLGNTSGRILTRA